MSSAVFGAKQFRPTPPDKGSFPLDHDGECKQFYLRHMLCLSENKHNNSACKQTSKDYLECRMQKGLMAQESWENLGLADVKAE
jgi:cytochrome c oxidase assembly protein subunit 19